MSTKRKKTVGNPANRSVGRPTLPFDTTPEGLLRELTRSTAERVLTGLQVLERFAADYPDVPHVTATRIAYEAASLALMEALGLQEGTPPLDEQARKVLTR